MVSAGVVVGESQACFGRKVKEGRKAVLVAGTNSRMEAVALRRVFDVCA